MDPERRRLLTGAFVRPAQSGRSPAPRGPCPPVLLHDPVACARCEERPCLGACPEGIIVWDGAGQAPYLDFATGGCTFCEACAGACPHAADGPSPRRLGTVVLDAARCMAWNGVVCMSCLFACGERAIIADGRGRPSVTGDRCTGCGGCVSACPAGALTVPPM